VKTRWWLKTASALKHADAFATNSCLSIPCSGTPQHAGSQFWFGGKDNLFWDIGSLTPLLILRPTLGQIEFAIHKGMISLACKGQKDPDLKVRMSNRASTSQNHFLILRASLFQMADFLIIREKKQSLLKHY
jgi:hypothetical protein